jgi:SARP family transcriptional regulator, regulator of embCAB operon
VVPPPAPPRLSVLGGFRFWEGGRSRVTLTGGSQRLLAFLALSDGSVTREVAAGILYPDSSERHAYASLRSTLSRLDPLVRPAVLVSVTELCLADGVAVDLREARALARRLVSRADRLPEDDLDVDAVAALSLDLLPGWYDEWVMVQSEDWRQLRLHALEALTGRLAAQQRYGDAVASALAAIRAEPLRESARGALIRVHLAEGNQSEALDEFGRYRRLLQAELGLEPTARLRDLLARVLDP